MKRHKIQCMEERIVDQHLNHYEAHANNFRHEIIDGVDSLRIFYFSHWFG